LTGLEMNLFVAKYTLAIFSWDVVASAWTRGSKFRRRVQTMGCGRTISRILAEERLFGGGELKFGSWRREIGCQGSCSGRMPLYLLEMWRRRVGVIEVGDSG